MKTLILEKLSTSTKNVKEEVQALVSDIVYMLFYSMTPKVDWTTVGGMPTADIESALSMAFADIKSKLTMYSEFPEITISSIAKRNSVLYINLKFSFSSNTIYKNVSLSI